MIKPSKFIEADYLFIFLDYLRCAWDEDYRLVHRERLRRVLERTRKEGVNKINPFAYLSSGDDITHFHLNPKTPWRWKVEDGKRIWDLQKWQRRYWFLFRDFNKLCAECGTYPQWQVTEWGYGFAPFESNEQGIKSFWDKKALRYQIRYARKILRITKRIIRRKLDPDFIPRWTPMNESRNPWKYGNAEKRHEFAHVLAEWHQDIFEAVKKKGLSDIEHLMIDCTLAERPIAHLVTWMPSEKACHICKQEWDNWNNKEYGRKLRVVVHQKSIVDDVPQEAGTFLRSWGHKKTSEDGSSNKKCKGPRFLGTNYRVGNPKQVYEYCKHVFTMAKSINAEWHHGLFPMETSEKTPDERGLQQAYTVEKIHWRRFKEAIRAEKEVYGE